MTEPAAGRLMGRYQIWAGDFSGNSWLSPFSGQVLHTDEAVRELDRLLKLPDEQRPLTLRGQS